MSKKVFVGGLSLRTNEEILRGVFEKIGAVEDAKIVTDHETGRSKGFGFVSFADSNTAFEAIAHFDGHDLDGRCLKVSAAIESSRPNSRKK